MVKIGRDRPPLQLVSFPDLSGDPEGVKALVNTVKLKTVIFTAKGGELFTSFVLQRPNGDFHRLPSDQCLAFFGLYPVVTFITSQ